MWQWGDIFIIKYRKRTVIKVFSKVTKRAQYFSSWGKKTFLQFEFSFSIKPSKLKVKGKQRFA